MSVYEPEVARHTEERLRSSKERIIAHWAERVREEIPAASGEPHLIIVDTLPAVLDQLAEAISPDHPRRAATEGSTVATEHGGERVRLTHFRLEDLIAEYKILRQVLFEILEEDGALSAEERGTLNTSLDQAISEACAGYALVQASLRDQLFAIVAHDLRNPLGVAQTTAHLILMQPTAQEVRQWAARVVENIDRVDAMVQDLLDVIRVQTRGRRPLELEVCDLTSLIGETVEHLRVELGDRLVLEAPEPVLGHFAPDPLRRAVENLATNAAQYGSPGTPITVKVSCFQGRAIISVHNHGSHVPPQKQETLFRAFHRATEGESGGHRGWGLGLAQARAAAESHGGSIAVDSVRSMGTTFIIDIPADARPFQWTPVTPGSVTPP